jgi:hypothetical protein
MSRSILVFVLTLLGGTGLGARSVRIQTATAPPCPLQTVFVHVPMESTANRVSPDTYAASNCDVIFSDGSQVHLPKLEGTLPLRVTVRNVGSTNIVVLARGPEDVIDGTVARYSVPYEWWLPVDTALLCCAGSAYVLSPQYAITFTAMPAQLPNSWFTTSSR